MKRPEHRVILIDDYELEEWERFSARGLAKAMFLEEVYAKRLLKAVNKLPELERKVISLHYGVDGEKAKTLKQISLVLETTIGKVGIIEERALRMLLFNYDGEMNSDSIGNLEISVRVYLALNRAGYTSIKHLKEMNLQELKKIRFLGKRALNELQEALRKHQ